jgi:FkbH-like protein
MIIYSDINLEPFLRLKNISSLDYYYREDYLFPDEIENQTVIFIFSDFFRLYSKSNIETILNLIKFASRKNRVILVGDLLFGKYFYSNENILINSGISKEDYNLELGYYSQFPFNKSGIKKLKNLISSTVIKLKQPIIKSIFVDLDNTLIPGVWEEDKSYIKKNYLTHKNWKFRRLLQILVKCHSHGSQIIVVSKNDYNSIVEALDFIFPNWKEIITHIDSGWGQKGQRIESNIKKMNIGSQDCLFIDDNEIEITNVQIIVPGIQGIHFNSSDKLNLIEDICLHSLDFKKNLDVDRNKFYSNALGSKIDMSLGVAITKYKSQILIDNDSDYERLKELSVKTNQMNFNKFEVININISDYKYVTVHCTTEFANLGMIGYYILNKKNMVIENFVMSCRALGFGLEKEFIESALEHTRRFRFKKTEKNNVAQILIDKYIKNGRIIV